MMEYLHQKERIVLLEWYKSVHKGVSDSDNAAVVCRDPKGKDTIIRDCQNTTRMARLVTSLAYCWGNKEINNWLCETTRNATAPTMLFIVNNAVDKRMLTNIMEDIVNTHSHSEVQFSIKEKFGTQAVLVSEAEYASQLTMALCAFNTRWAMVDLTVDTPFDTLNHIRGLHGSIEHHIKQEWSDPVC